MKSLVTWGLPSLEANFNLPALVERAGWKAADRFIQFFLAELRTDNTRFAYARAVADFLSWAEQQVESTMGSGGFHPNAAQPISIPLPMEVQHAGFDGS